MNRFLKYVLNPSKAILKLKKRYIPLYDDKRAIEEMWNANMDYPLNLCNPQTFNEKLQWMKLYYRNPLYPVLADKYRVKQWIGDNIGQEYVIPTIGVYQDANDIDLGDLPNQFVLKCNHDCGSVIICRDKKKFDFESAKQKLNECLKRDFFLPYREWCYKDIPRRIICEPLLQEKGVPELTDYKFFCFNGEPKFMYVSYGLANWQSAYINYMNLDWTPAPFHRPDFQEFTTIPPKPSKYIDMIQLVKKVSHGFPFMRVDLYQIGEQIYVSELTFYPGAGIDKFVPEEWDRKIGDLFELPSKWK